MFIPKLIYNDGASEGGGNTEVVDKSTTENTNDTDLKNDAPVEIPKAFLTEEEVKSLGFDSKEAFINYVQQKKQQDIPDEEKQKEQELENASLRKYAIEKGYAKEADFKKYQTITEKQDYDLVFENYLEEFKEDNPEITDPEELSRAAKEDFEKTYKLNSENAKTKERALSKIKQTAKELRTPVESVITTAKTKYAEEKEIAAKLPDFQKLVANKVKQHTPDKAIVYRYKDGDTEIPIEIDITEKEREQMTKMFANRDNYNEYSKGKAKELEAALDEQMQQWVKAVKSDEIVKKALEEGIKIGQKKGSNKGADNPFPLINSGTNTKGADGKSVRDQIRESHNEAAKSYIK